MKLYNGAWQAKEVISKAFTKQYNTEDRECLLTALFNSVNNAYEFIKFKQYINTEEKNRAVKLCIKNPIIAARILTEFPDILTQEQHNFAFETALESWESVRILFNKYNLSPEMRNKVLKLIVISSEQVQNCIKDNKLDKSEIEYILKYHIGDTNVINKVLKHYKTNDDARLKAFDARIKNRTETYKLAIDKYFLPNEIKIIHDIYWGQFHEELKKKYRDYVEYCTVFQTVLNDTEWELLTKKLMNHTRKNEIKDVMHDIKFPEEYRFKLEGYLMVHKLIASN